MPRVNQRSFGTVRQLPSGRYQARWMGPDGHRHTAPETFPTREAAKLWLASVRVARSEDRHVERRHSAVTFAAYAAAWRDRGLTNLRPSTRVRDLGYLDRYVLPTLGPMPLHDVTADVIEQWVVDMLAGGSADGTELSAATVTKAGQVLSKVLDAAVRSHRLTSNPATGVKWPRTERAEMMTLQPTQIEALAQTIDGAGTNTGKGWRRGRHSTSYRALVMVGCYCGLRIGEMVALRVRDVDLAARTITVTRAVTEVEGHHHLGSTKTSAGRRSVPIPAALVAELANAMYGKHLDDPVFPNTQGDWLRVSNFRSQRWAPAVKAAGLEGFRIHDMRHTAITLWLQAGIDVKEIAAWAGHTSVVTVLDRYAHVRPGRPDPMAALDALIDAKGPPRPPRGKITPIR